MDGIDFHPALHGFRKHRGCGTAILQCRLEQEHAILKGKTLYQVYIDLTKAYDTLDRDRTLLLLEGYGVGDNVCRILRNFWDRLTLCAKQGGYYSRHLIPCERGVTTEADLELVAAAQKETFSKMQQWMMHAAGITGSLEAAKTAILEGQWSTVASVSDTAVQGLEILESLTRFISTVLIATKALGSVDSGSIFFYSWW